MRTSNAVGVRNLGDKAMARCSSAWPTGTEIQCVIRDDQMEVVVVRLEFELYETGVDHIYMRFFIQARAVVAATRSLWLREVD